MFLFILVILPIPGMISDLLVVNINWFGASSVYWQFFIQQVLSSGNVSTFSQLHADWLLHPVCLRQGKSSTGQIEEMKCLFFCSVAVCIIWWLAFCPVVQVKFVIFLYGAHYNAQGIMSLGGLFQEAGVWGHFSA